MPPSAWILILIASLIAAGSAAAAAHVWRLRAEEKAASEGALNRLTAHAEACEIRASETAALYDALQSGCAAGVIVLDGADIIVSASGEACRMIGAAAAQLVGRSLLQATLSSDLNSCLKCAREQNSVQHCEIRPAGATGTCLSITIIPVASDAAERRRCLIIASDITELRRLEVIRKDFVANVSHELRTPLTSIRAMADTLQEGALRDAEVADHFLGIISTEAQRLTRISEDLLVLSHAESRLAEDSVVGLSDLVVDVCHRFQNQAKSSGIQLSVSAEPGLSVKGSPDQMEQVLINLVDNAIKYTQEGGKVCVQAEKHGSTAVVHVADTGIGILSQDLPRIFERFYRVDKARSRQSGGTGLGLSIVKHIVEAHGGGVTVESEFNRGSKFSFTVPCA